VRKYVNFQVLVLILLSVILFGVVSINGPTRASAYTIDDAITNLQEVYDKLNQDPIGKSAVIAAKSNLQNITGDPASGPWPGVFSYLYNEAVRSRLQCTELEAKQKIINFVRDLAAMQYSSNSTELRSHIDSFKLAHSTTITRLFGNDFTVDDLCNYFLSAKNHIPGAISQSPQGLLNIAMGNYLYIRQYEKVWICSALNSAATGRYSTFPGKLSAIGWSIDKLVDAKDRVSNQVDPNLVAEIALMKAYVRSETKLIVDGSPLPPGSAIVLIKGTSVPCTLSILGYAQAGLIASWLTDNASIARIENGNLIAVGPGTTRVIAYNRDPNNEWAYIAAVIVPGPPGNVSFTDNDLDQGQLGGAIKFYSAPEESVISKYRAYFLDQAGSRMGEIGEVNKGPANRDSSGRYRITVPDNTVLPALAVKIGVYSVNNNEIVSDPATTTIIDLIRVGTVHNAPVTINVNQQGGTQGALEITSAPTVSGSNTTYTLPQVNITAGTSAGNVTVDIPPGAIISGNASTWNGVINVPTAVQRTDAELGISQDSSVHSVIEIGFGDVPLTLDSAARIVLTNQAGKRVGYSRNGVFTEITTVCQEDTQAWVDTNLPAGGDGKLDVGNDLVVWTKHFTVFITFSRISSPGGGGGGGGGQPAPGVSEVFPAKEASDVDPDIIITATLDIDVEAVDMGKITIQDSEGNKVGGVTAVLEGRKLVIKHEKFAYLTKYTVTIPEKTVKGQSSGKSNAGISWSFTTRGKDMNFTDLPKTHWALEDIKKLYRLDIINGYPDNTLRPEASITRAEFAAILAKALGIPIQVSVESAFLDVPGAAWYFGPVQAMAKAGLVKGYQGKFSPDELITRQEMAVILAKALKDWDVTAALEGTLFTDWENIAPWARASVARVDKQGLMRGYPDGAFGPRGYATRAEVCTVICRLLDKNKIPESKTQEPKSRVIH